MNGWFTVEQLDADTYAISEYGHWEETHCYLLCGETGALLIDTGLGVSDVRAVTDALTSLPTAVALTHAHWDHIGGLGRFEHFAVHAAEAPWLTDGFPLPRQAVLRNLTAKPCAFPEAFSSDAYRVFQGTPQRILQDGDCFDLGNRLIRAIHTPGHSPGHCCFYEPERKYLYTGDLIYSGCLDAFYPTTDPALFLRSVRRAAALETDRLLPGHHCLHLPVGLVSSIAAGLGRLERSGSLRHGAGLFDFGDFQIRL